MNAHDIRAEFRDFIGVERFCRFVHQIVRDSPERDELRFWQDRCWREFLDREPDAPTQMGGIRDLFLWCFVHDRALKLADIHQPLPEIRKTDDWHTALTDSFPFSFGSYLCPDCVSALETWISNHDCEILRRKTTWESYRTAHASKTTRKFTKALKVGAMVIETDMMEGDELWEWDGGDGITGLAIVRDGKMKTSWHAPLA